MFTNCLSASFCCWSILMFIPLMNGKVPRLHDSSRKRSYRIASIINWSLNQSATCPTWRGAKYLLCFVCVHGISPIYFLFIGFPGWKGFSYHKDFRVVNNIFTKYQSGKFRSDKKPIVNFFLVDVEMYHIKHIL